MTPALPGFPGFGVRFADFEGVAYLDAANQGPLPLAAVRAGREALAWKERPDRLPESLYFTLPAEVRALYARLFSCREESVALTTGCGQAVNAVARGLELHPGDEVLVAPAQFPSNFHPWLALERRGVKVVEAEPDHPSGAVSAERLAAQVSARTRVVAFAHVGYLDGARIEPGPVVEAARRVGAVTVVDGSQAAGALPFDFGASGVDLYSASAYKFLLGPYGSAVGLFSPRLLDRLPLGDVVWWALRGSEDFNHLSRRLELRDGAQRFDAHEPASFNNLMPLGESLRLLLEASAAAVHAHARTICDRVLAKLPPGFEAASPLEPDRRSHILCLKAGTPRATEQAFERLEAARVRVSLRGDRLRIAPHLYNTEEEADRLLAALR